MPFTLPPLPYPKNALTKAKISEETLTFHYEKHHQGYVTKLNELTAGKPEGQKTLEELIKTSDGAIFNNAAQVWNHTFYWNCMSPNGGGQPTGKVGDMITKKWGSFDEFKEIFSQTAITHFGSGWAWLVLNNGQLEVIGLHDAGNPIREGKIPLLTCDVWEHAYYIDFRNLRKDYVSAWWNVVNWDFVNKNLGGSCSC